MLHQSQKLKCSTPPVPYQAGMMAVAVFTHTFTAAFTAASDVLELGSIPAGAQVVGATCLSDNLAASTTADIGILDGGAGEKDDARDITTDLIFDGVDVAGAATENDATTRDCLALAPVADHRGLGLTLSQNQTAAANKKITVVVNYIY